jgi:N6-adenosine-specific RNA methylase IME4
MADQAAENAHLPAGPFSTIVADPPWTYTYSTRKTEAAGTGWHGAAQRHYKTMTMAEIAAMPIADLAHDDAVLWLWIVNPMLPRCIEVARAWGFEYRGLLTWAKTARADPTKPFIGTGYWLRGATEHAVLAVRGKPKPLVRNVPTWFSAPPTRHSEKPEAATRIFETYIDGPRLELFARRPRDGWTTWGNEIKDAA